MSEPAQKATLYLNMIIGDFETVETVKKCLDSVKDQVDGMYVTVTFRDEQPSADHPLVALLKDFKANVSFYKWNLSFCDARNYALSQVPKGKNIFFYWQDVDDVLRGAEHLHKIADEMIGYSQSAIYFDYWYQVELDEKQEVREILVKHKRERIIRNDDTFKWIGDLHETLIEQKQENVIRHGREECQIVHLTSPERLDKNIDRNIEILENMIRKENRKDPRPIIYLAKAYLDKAKFTPKAEDRKIYLDLALNLFHEYLAGSGTIGSEDYREGSGWREERAQAWSHVAEIALLTGHPEMAISAYQSAIDEAPEFPNFYIDLSLCYIMQGDFKKAREWLNVATTKPEPKTTIVTMPRDMKARAMEASFQINMHFGKLDWALEDAQNLVKVMPNEKMAQERLEQTKKLHTFNKACQNVVALSKFLEEIKEADKIQHLINAMPEDMKREPFAAEMRNLFMPPKKWESDEIAILCGPGFEEWSPNSVDTGVGGSEEAVIYNAKELAKLGWKITVYANPGKDYGEHEGVKYVSWHELNPKDEFNVLVLWRSVAFLDINPKTKFTLVWMHDVPSNPDLTEERINKIDKIAVLSEYHKSLFRMAKDGAFAKIPDQKFFLTSNGIPEIDIKEWKGNPHRMAYVSSPDRGLVYLLRNWKKIRNEVPDAELHVFYGWNVYDVAHKGNPAREQWKETVLKMMKQDGIFNHDRVGHNALHFELSKSGVWSYPTDFTEISCISAMKAQACGAVPVVTDFAALSETVKNGLKVDVDITTEEGQEEYIKALIGLLKNPEQQADIRKSMMPWAQDYFQWKHVAKLWDELMRVKIQNPDQRRQGGE